MAFATNAEDSLNEGASRTNGDPLALLHIHHLPGNVGLDLQVSRWPANPQVPRGLSEELHSPIDRRPDFTAEEAEDS